MKFERALSKLRGTEPGEGYEHRHIALFVSPLADKSQETLGKSSDSEDNLSGYTSDEPVFKHRHESSTIELFYDLFFVANLASFTMNHEINSGATFRSYLGFFSLLWATWLQTSLFDVRFAYDSIFERCAKAIHLGVMTGFIIAGAIYSTSDVYAARGAFRVIAIVLMMSRLTLVIQYASVLWHVKGYPKTWVPLLSTMGVLFAAAMVYLGTHWGFNYEGSHVYYAWYIVAPIEIVLCIVISSIWRVMSFKRTHLVERIGLLTLIIIGEGIIGLSKSISYLLQSSTNVSARNAGVLVCSVLLIYFIWMLYFDQVQTDRMGTIKQQIWALLHFPLHLCILFTVEGSTNLYIWNVIAPIYQYWLTRRPIVPAGKTIEEIWPTANDLVGYVNASLNSLKPRFKEDKQLYKYYDYTQNITALQNISAPYGSDEYLVEANDLVILIWRGVSNAIFEVFGVIVDDKDIAASGAETAIQREEAQNIEVFHLFETVFMYFYISAGLLLVALSALYIIGNKRKTGGEWFMIGFRIVVGTGITMTLVAVTYSAADFATEGFLASAWHIIIVMFAYLIVIIVDALLIQRALNMRLKRDGNRADTEKRLGDTITARGTSRNFGKNYSYQRAKASADEHEHEREQENGHN